MSTLRFVRHGLVLALAAAAVVPAAREAVHWHWAKARNSSAAWDAFIAEWGASTRLPQAIEFQDEARWNEVRNSGRAELFEQYVASARRTEHMVEARSRGDDLRWREASGRETVRSLQFYLDRYPEGRNAERARQRQAQLRANDWHYQAALGKGNAKALEEFLAEFPGHARAEQARVALQDLAGRDLFELIREKKVQASASIEGTLWGVRLRRLAPHTVLVQIAPGTGFVPREGGNKARLVLQPYTKALDSPRETVLYVNVMALLPERGGPPRRDGFQLRPAAEQPKYTALLEAAERNKATPATKRSAVWIVSANAGQAELSRLADLDSGPAPTDVDIAAAMRLVDDRGTDIRTRAIWKERRAVASRLPEGTLRAWLEKEP
jgi:hypothetical protein